MGYLQFSKIMIVRSYISEGLLPLNQIITVNQNIKRTVSEISSEPPCKDGKAQLTTVTLKAFYLLL